MPLTTAGTWTFFIKFLATVMAMFAFGQVFLLITRRLDPSDSVVHRADALGCRRTASAEDVLPPRAIAGVERADDAVSRFAIADLGLLSIIDFLVSLFSFALRLSLSPYVLNTLLRRACSRQFLRQAVSSSSASESLSSLSGAADTTGVDTAAKKPASGSLV